jgi:hypothetical protein
MSAESVTQFYSDVLAPYLSPVISRPLDPTSECVIVLSGLDDEDRLSNRVRSYDIAFRRNWAFHPKPVAQQFLGS